MNKKIIGLVFVLIVIISSIVLFNFISSDSEDTLGQESEDYSVDDMMNEIDESLLGEDDEVEIGEMI